MLIGEDECSGVQTAVLNPDTDLEYLSPCDTGVEREEIQVPKAFKKLVIPKH